MIAASFKASLTVLRSRVDASLYFNVFKKNIMSLLADYIHFLMLLQANVPYMYSSFATSIRLAAYSISKSLVPTRHFPLVDGSIHNQPGREIAPIQKTALETITLHNSITPVGTRSPFWS
jgi:hypothetical protein